MQITTLRLEQVAEVADVWEQSIRAEEPHCAQPELSVKRLEAITRDPNFLPSGAVVATDSGVLIGLAIGYVQTIDFHGEGNVEAKPGRLAGITVKPSHQRKGIGRRLLEAVETSLAEAGKAEIAFETYRMPIALARGPYLDSGPYRFFLSCGYRPLAHEMWLRNDLERFELGKELEQRRERLSREGIEYRLCEPSDREALLAFMAAHFPGGWQLSIEQATERSDPRPVLLALASGQIVGFMGPFYVGEPGEPGHFGSPGVAAEFRGRGIGKLMFHLGLDHLKTSGASETTYSTGTTNPARFIYFDSGAELVGTFCCHLRKSLIEP